MDRRQPAVRWSAVFAGAAVAAGTWVVLQLLFTGGALAALDPSDVDDVVIAGVGTTVGTVLAALIAVFLGGLVAGRIAGHFDRKVAGLHGILVWALSAVAGLALVGHAISRIGDGYPSGDLGAGMPMGAERAISNALGPINERLVREGRPEVTLDDFVDAAGYAATPTASEDYSTALFAARLDAQTALTRADAEEVVRGLGPRADELLAAGDALADYRSAALRAADRAGKAMIATGVSLLLCLLAAVGGALLAASRWVRPPRRRADTEPGFTAAPVMPADATAADPVTDPIGAPRAEDWRNRIDPPIR